MDILEDLLKDFADYTKQRDEAVAQYNAANARIHICNGAIQAVQHLIEKVRKAQTAPVAPTAVTGTVDAVGDAVSIPTAT